MTQLTTKKIYIIAGEASGDLHGSNLLKEFIQQNNESNSPLNLQFSFWGGDKMEEAIGQKPIKHFKELAFMGFVEVLANIRTILGNIAFCKKDIEAFQPDALLLIDYPGFNLRIAEWAKLKGIKIYYYISPTVWAWKESRVYKIKKAVDHMFVILPFEKPFYDKFNYHVDYVGHPLLDAIHQYRFIQKDRVQFIHENKLNQDPIIAILPGSRKQEIRKKLPVMLEAVKDLANYQIIVAGAPSLDHSFYQEFIKSNSVKIVHGKTYDLLSASEAAIVTSGTATLETALLDIPEVVCYKTSKISYSIAKRLVKIKFISLVNLIMDKEVVRELIQDDCTSETIKTELSYILEGGKNRNRILNEYQEMKKILGEGGASKKVAQLMLKTIQD
jgi:lipid-A-disaccharide synthase